MHPLNVYGYHVRYGSSEHKSKDFDIHESVCFSSLFGSGCKSKYYRIIILKNDADLNRYYSNYCFFDKKQIINHLKQLPKFCNIKFSVTEINYNNDEAFQIDIHIDSNKRIIHKYVLTWIRTLFEWPFYLYLLHAKELHKLPEFRFESIINLFNVIASVHKDSFNVNIHTFGTDLTILRKKDIISRINNTNLVNNVFPKFRADIPQCELPSDFDEINLELFNKNCPIYIKAYHIIKNHESSDNWK